MIRARWAWYGSFIGGKEMVSSAASPVPGQADIAPG
jgi:hypothetical protein